MPRPNPAKKSSSASSTSRDEKAVAVQSERNEAFSLDAHMEGEKTRVFTYNGKRLVSLLGRETFPGERTFKLPPKVIEFACRQPLTSALLPCRIGYFPYAAGQKVSRPNGDWAYTLLFCLDGVGVLDLADSQHKLERGSFVLLRPFEFHAYEADEHRPWSYYWIHFNGTTAQQYYEALTGGGRKVVVAVEPDIGFVETFEKILRIYDNGHAYRMLVQASTSLHQLLGDLFGRVAHGHSDQVHAKVRIERTIEVMANNLGMHVSIHELAATAHMSQAYYAQQFRRYIGDNPRSYFNRLKISKACEYLRQTNAKVESVARLVGYEDAFYFSRLFHRLVGCTPTDFRRNPDRTAPGIAPRPVQ
jgi:AraC-like DNA-binding protein